MTTVADPVRTEILDTDEGFFAALLEGDPERLAALLRTDFVIVDVVSGTVAGRDALVDAVAKGAVTFKDIRRFPEEALVRRYGDVALVVGRTRMTFELPGGSMFTGGSRYTHAFTLADGRWHLVSAQGTAIPEPQGQGSRTTPSRDRPTPGRPPRARRPRQGAAVEGGHGG